VKSILPCLAQARWAGPLIPVKWLNLDLPEEVEPMQYLLPNRIAVCAAGGDDQLNNFIDRHQTDANNE
jgi:hypothetical protein